MILAGDIGGTNTRLALCEQNDSSFRTIVEENYASAAFSGLDEIVEKFLGDKSNKIERACFGVAGPVTGEVVELANLSWTIDARAMKNLLAIEHISLINDLEANAYGLQELGKADFVILHEGAVNPTGNGAIIAAGTGLGEAGLYFEEGASGKFRPFPSEGGHADFAPRNDFEIELLRFLLVKFGRISVERIVSGQGLRNIYEFLRETKRLKNQLGLLKKSRRVTMLRQSFQNMESKEKPQFAKSRLKHSFRFTARKREI
jgi:glucokinase